MGKERVLRSTQDDNAPTANFAQYHAGCEHN